MIPHVIHCFWEGGAKTQLANKCIASWRRIMPDWKVKEWNLARLEAEDIDVSCPFFDEAVSLKKWSFASDVARWAILLKEGGVFLDSDVEVLRPLLDDGPWLAAERDDPLTVAPGLGIAFPARHPFAQAMLNEYAGIRLDPDRLMSLASPRVIDRMLGHPDRPRILSACVMNPLGWSGGRVEMLPDECRAIHWYAASWLSWKQRLVYVTFPRLGLDIGKIWRRLTGRKQVQDTE